MSTTRQPIVIGRYTIYDELAAGGIATVHVGRLQGPAGFSRTVAIKRLHPQFAKDPSFVAMILEEARIASRIVHPNVVSVLDVIATDDEVLLVMDYVHGDSVSRLVSHATAAGARVPPAIASAIAVGVLRGLHAAHEVRGSGGEPLEVVHRDVSPQNIVVGVDGVPRLLDFGIAKALGRANTTMEGQVKGKVGYMAPEQVQGVATRQSDVFSTFVVLWEMLVGRRLFAGTTASEIVSRLLFAPIQTPSDRGADGALDEVMMRGLDRTLEARYETAEEAATEIERCVPPASSTEVGKWVAAIAADTLRRRGDLIRDIENTAIAPPPAAAARDHTSTVDDPSTVPIDHRAERPGGGQRWKRTVPILFALAILGFAFALVRWRSIAPPSNSEPLPMTNAASSSPPSSPSEVAPTSSGAPPPAAALTHEQPPSVASPKRPPKSTTAPSAKVPGPVAPSASKLCSPPYRYDDNGKKVWLRECL